MDIDYNYYFSITLIIFFFANNVNEKLLLFC